MIYSNDGGVKPNLEINGKMKRFLNDMYDTIPETDLKHLKIGILGPKRKPDHLPTINFQG